MTHKILITAGRLPVALDLARKLHNAGHMVFVADTFRAHGCRFSRSVSKVFATPSPRKHPESFINALVDIVSKNGIDLLIPCFEETLHLAKARDRFPSHCEILCSPFEVLHDLHHKWTFYEKLCKYDLNAPKTILIESADQLQELDFDQPYALKASYSRAALGIHYVDPEKPLPPITINPHNPWLAQEWLEGRKYCTYSFCRNGRILAHTTYPVRFAVRDRWCVIFEAIQHAGIYQWVENFVQREGYTGQLGFDLVETSDDRLFALECNPRPTSGVHLFDDCDQLDRAFVEEIDCPIMPKLGTRRQIALGFLAFGWRSLEARRSPAKYLRALLGVKDVVLRFRDPLPWLMQPWVFAAYCWRAKREGLSIPALITHDFEWNAESAAQPVVS